MVAGERELETAAERGAVDGGDDGPAQRLQAPQLPLDVVDHRGEVRGVLGPHAAQPIEVAAGEERLLGGGDHDARDLFLLGLQAGEDRLHRLLVVEAHGVRRLARRVHGEDDDPVASSWSQPKYSVLMAVTPDGR